MDLKRKPDAVPEVLETLSTNDLIKAWRQDFGIDVSALFESVPKLDLIDDGPTSPIRFEPAILGDAVFYQALRKFAWYHPGRKLEHAHIAALVKAGDLVLDVGAGEGGFASHLQTGEYIGLESDPQAVALGGAQSRDLRALEMQAWRAAVDYRAAHWVTAFQVLEHVAEPQGFLRELADCAAPGGCVAVGVPDAESYVTDLPDFMLNAPPHHVSWWTAQSLTHAMEDAGLQIDDVVRFPVEPWEKQLWWMAKVARCLRRDDTLRFGQSLRARKILSFILAWPLQILPIPKQARGSTLLVIARRPPATT